MNDGINTEYSCSNSNDYLIWIGLVLLMKWLTIPMIPIPNGINGFSKWKAEKTEDVTIPVLIMLSRHFLL